MIFDEKTIFPNVTRKIAIWEKFLLLFRRTKVDISEDDYMITKTKYKMMKGKMYIFEMTFIKK